MRSLLMLLGVLLAVPAWAQNPNVITPSPQRASAVSSGACVSGTNCGEWNVTAVRSVTLQVSGTFAGTLTFEATADGANWVAVLLTNLTDGTQATTTTTTGAWSIVNSGFTALRARMTSYTSGTAVMSAVLGNGGSIPIAVASTSAPNDAEYWLAVADASLANAKVLGALGTGLVFNTTTTGVPSVVVCATAGTVLIGGAPPTCSASPTVTELISGNVTLTTGGAVRGSTTTAQTWLLQGYDNNTGPGYVTFGTITNGNTPSLAFSEPAGGATITYAGQRFTPTGSTASGNSIYLPATNTVGISINGDGLYAADNAALFSLVNNVYTSGKSSSRWANVFSVLGNFSGAVTLTAGVVGGCTGAPTVSTAGINTTCIEPGAIEALFARVAALEAGIRR